VLEEKSQPKLAADLPLDDAILREAVRGD